MTTTTDYILKRIEKLESQLAELRRQLVVETPGEIQSTRGIWRDFNITDNDIEEAKRIWTKRVDDGDF
jgi:hypothetical protein